MQNDIRSLWGGFYLDKYILLDSVKTDYGYSATVSCKHGGSFEDLKRYKPSFDKVYQCSTYFFNEKFNDTIKIDFVKIKKDLEYKYIKLSPYKLLIGYNYKYEPIIIDMKVTPHLGVVGISNNGKSKCIELALKNLRGADIHLINCMDNDFTSINGKRINGESDILDYFYYIIHDDKVLERPLYIVIDEYNVLSNLKGIDDIIEELLRQARHRNIFIIVLMQQATKDECNFKNLFNCRLCFKQIDKSQYYAFLGSTIEDVDLQQREFILLHTKIEYGTTYKMEKE